MENQPVIQGVIAKNCQPEGCREAVRQQINAVQRSSFANAPAKNILILGASSGFGLATRIVANFGLLANTLNLSFEKPPSEKGTGSAGWHNNQACQAFAEEQGLTSINKVGDAFSAEFRKEVREIIKEHFDGHIDLLIYSLATGGRPDPESGELIRSAIKPIDEPYQGYTLDLEHEALQSVTLQPATPAEITDTVKVMGGEDWYNWVQELQEEHLLSNGFRTMAYSYIGPEITHAIYHHGTLGRAKQDLQQYTDRLNELLAIQGGGAWLVVCKALVTKASVFIPGFGPYLMALYKVMKQQGVHEGCIEQMIRLFSEKNALANPTTDDQRMIRLDDWELRGSVQGEVSELLQQATPENFRTLLDYDGVRQDFLNLNGFDLMSATE
ncbi:enoyl-ACP reductase FabV [Endozoicomonas numazuensis]|uniref:enoyl-ACP reductase FabV n=1 Tax=Endozoicomonas numazuensis TaxID=1137799 RepID=UPI0005521EE3|nr:enoyl-ACP reductase FabV [Endozoicomonas numazuensis]